MLLLLQAVRNAASPVHVIVDSAPKSGDWPEWLKILISALAAGVAGLVGGFYLDRWKRRSDKKEDAAKMMRRIDGEFAKNYAILLAAKEIMGEFDNLDDPTKQRARELLGSMGPDTTMIQHYRSHHLVEFSESTDCLKLARMYRFFKTGVCSFPAKKPLVEMTSQMAAKYAERKGINVQKAEVWKKMLHGQLEEAGRLLME